MKKLSSIYRSLLPSAGRGLLALILLCPLLELAACGLSSNSSVTGSAGSTTTPTVVGLQAVAGNAQVSLTWTAIAGTTSYHVKRATTNGGPYAQVAASTAASHADLNLVNGTVYYYVVSAVVGGAEGANSAPVSAKPAAPITIPAVPTALVATAGISQITLGWQASTGATAYYVKRATVSGGPYVVIGAPTTAAYADTGLDPGLTFYYVVSAVNGAGESANSAEASGTPIAPAVLAAVPTGLVAAAGVSRVNMIWVASTGAATYNVKRSTATGGPYTTIGSTTSASYTDSNLTNGTTYYYVVSAVNATGESANSAEANATPVAPDVTVTIDPTHTQPISPYIYGINDYAAVSGAPPSLTLDRSGGNRWTAYNWETNASNSGNDSNYTNDNFLSLSSTPAEAVRSRIAADQTNSMASLVTFQLQGYVAGDEAGPVNPTTPPPPDLTRFKTVQDAKGGAFTQTPSTTDAFVYMDEFAWNLDQLFNGQNIFGPAPTGKPTFVELDNQPELWQGTHLEVQGPTPVTSDAYITRTIALTQALKTQFPDLVIFGPVHYGFSGIYTWNGELAATPTGANWFPDKYLPAVNAASTTFGKPLVDVYD
ncbi:MAG: hypothetical protein QOD56_1912, partial [Gammaproteobacteria bacterium]|nr:hypothetical protein [Gammaproteobacteria bacterium]